jgi:hypothetical protein
VFVPLTPVEVVAAIGAATRAAARADDPGAPFSRGQLRSAASAARHLAVELESFAAQRRAVATEAGAATARAWPQLAARLAAAGGEDPAALAEPLCDLLAALREDAGPPAARLRAEVRGILARMADREVALLTAAIE